MNLPKTLTEILVGPKQNDFAQSGSLWDLERQNVLLFRRSKTARCLEQTTSEVLQKADVGDGHADNRNDECSFECVHTKHVLFVVCVAFGI